MYGVELSSFRQMQFSKWQDNSGLPAPNTISSEERKKRVLDWLKEQNKKMYTITDAEYAQVHKDYRGKYDSDGLNGTDFDGSRTLMTWTNEDGTVLLIEGASLQFVKNENENINPAIKKRI